MLRTLIVISTSCYEESLFFTYLKIRNIPANFLEFLSSVFAACSKPRSIDNYRKASNPRKQQRDQAAG